MNENTDKGTIVALLKRFTEQRLPRAFELEKKVNTGEMLTARDLEFLDQVFQDAQHIFSLAQKYPEYQEIVSKAVHLYSEITNKALENEKSKR